MSSGRINLNREAGTQYLQLYVDYTITSNIASRNWTVSAALKGKRTNSGYTTAGNGTFRLNVNGNLVEVTENYAFTSTEQTILTVEQDIPESLGTPETPAGTGTWRLETNYSGDSPIQGSYYGDVALDSIDVGYPALSISSSSVTTTGFGISISTSHGSYNIYLLGIWLNGTLSEVRYPNALSYSGTKSFTGLTPNTSYTVYISSDCANGRTTGQTLIVATLPIQITSMTLSSSCNVDEGGTLTLTPTVLPTNASIKTFDWSSSNGSIATVNSSGVVTGVAKGSATITATAKDGSGKSASTTVNVLRRVTGLTVTDNAVQVQTGETYQIQYSLQPTGASNQNVTFTSSDTNIATVSSSGLITAVSIGSAAITATTVDGGYTSTVSVDCLGEVVWTQIEPLNYLNTYDIDSFYSDFLYIRQKLIAKSYTVGSITKPSTAGRNSISINNIKSVFNAVESDINVLQSALDWINPYYGAAYIWPDLTTGKKAKVTRWIQWLNQCYAVIDGSIPKPLYLYDSSSVQIYDINGEKLLVYGGAF